MAWAASVGGPPAPAVPGPYPVLGGTVPDGPETAPTAAVGGPAIGPDVGWPAAAPYPLTGGGRMPDGPEVAAGPAPAGWGVPGAGLTGGVIGMASSVRCRP